MKFTEYAKNKNIYLLKDDLRFIQDRIVQLCAKDKMAVLRRYCEEWCKGMSECDIVAQKQNMGRRAANLYLLGLMDAKRD